MAPKLSDDEIDDLIYFTRAGEVADLNETVATLSSRESVSPAEILLAARDEGKSTCLHMATGNGNLGMRPVPVPLAPNVDFSPQKAKHTDRRPRNRQTASRTVCQPAKGGETGLSRCSQ